MKALQLLCTALVAGAALSKPQGTSNALTIFTRVFSLPNSMGNYLDVYQYIPDLFNTGLDNDIESVHQTGMWIYYENPNYNVESGGEVYFVHGVDLSLNFPNQYCNLVTSMRYAGNKDVPNADTWTLYEGEFFSGLEFYGESDAASLDYLDLKASSMVLTGESPWTIYSGQSYSGDSRCVYPDTDHDIGPFGDRLDFGIYTTMSAVGVPDNTIRSVKKGCWASKVATPPEVKYDFKDK
ncbi:uncharacterized protein LOC135199660, partial [Macrobrachium nipponense]|uniref:uncharacterized protein LOC135199660 n=1 Tax=Macrobrachium nipponense TaxID=159736 RepID=UPI0030C8477C